MWKINVINAKMCLEEQINYEYNEWEQYCLNGKDIYEIKYCFVPLWYSKIKAKLFKKKNNRKKRARYNR